MKIKIFVVIILLCVLLSVGCLSDSVESVESVEEETIENESTVEPAKLVIKSIKSEDEGIVFKIKNEGQSPAEDIYFAMIGIDYHPRFDENLRWNYSISNDTCNELINGAIRDNDFSLNTSFYGRYTKKRIQDPNNRYNHIIINLSGEPLHLEAMVYRDYMDVLEPGKMAESNMYIYWSHDRYIKVLYDGDYNIYEHKLYDKNEWGKDTFKSIIN